MSMNMLTILVLILCSVLVTAVKHFKDAARDEKPEIIAQHQAKEEEFAKYLEEGEAMQVLCETGTKQYTALTDRALIIEDKKGVHRIALDQIKKIKFSDVTGNRFVSADNVMQIKLTAVDGSTYKLFKYSQNFIEMTKKLMDNKK